MDKMAPAEAKHGSSPVKTVADGQTIVGAFSTEAAARAAIQRLERAGMPPDRIGIVNGNVRQAREAAGSYSPQGALIGALLGILLVAGFLMFGGDAVRQNAVSAGLGAAAIIIGLAFVGWLAGRARVLRQDEYEELEEEVERGDVLVTVVCDTLDGADQTRAILERAGAVDIKIEDTAESV
jgi:hypothetical protein